MKNKTQVMDRRSQIRISDWLFQEDDDFLMGKTPNDLPYVWEDEE